MKKVLFKSPKSWLLQGCRWDDKGGALEDSKPKELFCPMPVILVRAVTQVGTPCLGCKLPR